MTTKRIMREFKMNEISVVDRPAQKGATMTIMKRDTVTPENINKNTKDNNMSEKTLEEVTKSLETVTKALEDSKADLAKANILAAMSDEEKAAMAKMDDKAKADWMAMKPEDRKAKMSEAKKNDETVVIAGQTISKAEVGAGPFAVMKAQSETIAKAEERIAKAEAAATFAKFAKKASDEYSNLPGTDVEKAELLVAVAGLGDEMEKRFETVLKAANSALDKSFTKAGHSGKEIEVGSNEDKLDKAAKELQKSDSKLTYEQAYTKAMFANPDLVEV